MNTKKKLVEGRVHRTGGQSQKPHSKVRDLPVKKDVKGGGGGIHVGPSGPGG